MNKFKISLIIAVVIPCLYACHFDAPGLGGGSGELGSTCLIAMVRIIPTSPDLTDLGDSEPTLSFSRDDCIELGQTLNVGWTIERTDQPGISGNPIEISMQDWTNILNNGGWANILNDNGQFYCELGVSISSHAINTVGLGRWQVTHSLGDWSVTCEEVEIIACPTPQLDAALPVSHTTFNVMECVQDMLSEGELIDGATVDYP